jgi:hypothetical protein
MTMSRSGVAVVPRLRSTHIIGGVVFSIVVLASYAYFYQAGGANQNSRYDFIRAVVEKHTVRIDAFQENTTDKAIVDGHWYSDKAPGLALVAMPVVAVGEPVLRVVGVEPGSYRGVVALTYVSTVIGAGVPTVVAALVIQWIALRAGASAFGALLAGIAYALATPAWAYATLFWSHGLAACGLVVAFGAALLLRDESDDRRAMVLGLAVGLSAGWATITEFPSAIPAALLAGLAFLHARQRGAERKVVTGMAVGAAACASIVLAINWISYGSPFRFGYSNDLEFVLRRVAGEHIGFFNHRWPNLHVLREILFGRYRGLLPLSPFLVLAPFGMVRLARRPGMKASTVVLALIVVYFIIENSAFRGWYGGSNFGPRYLAGALPFLCLPLAFLWRSDAKVLRLALLGLIAYGLAMSVVAVSTNPEPAAVIRDPVWDQMWPAFRAGHLSSNTESFLSTGIEAFGKREFSWNVGEKLGLHGLPSLLPLAAVWMLGIGVGVWLVRAHRPAETDEDPLMATEHHG